MSKGGKSKLKPKTGIILITKAYDEIALIDDEIPMYKYGDTIVSDMNIDPSEIFNDTISHGSVKYYICPISRDAMKEIGDRAWVLLKDVANMPVVSKLIAYLKKIGRLPDGIDGGFDHESPSMLILIVVLVLIIMILYFMQSAFVKHVECVNGGIKTVNGFVLRCVNNGILREINL